MRLRELEREVEASRAIYQAFLTRARETGEQQSIDNTNARVISSATPPRDKSWPPRLLLLAVALFGGLGIGTGVGLMREYFDESVYSRRALPGLTGVPVLAVTPALTRRLSRWSDAHRLGARTAARLADEGEAQSQTELMIGAMRRLRDALFDGGEPRRGHSLLVTSATPGEGRTTVALNLALTAAAEGWRVLLVDADISARDAVEDARRRRQCRPVRPDRGPRDARFGAAQRHRHRADLPAARQRDAHRKPHARARRRSAAEARPVRTIDLVDHRQRRDARPTTTCARSRSLPTTSLLVVRAGGPKRDDIAAALEALRQNAREGARHRADLRGRDRA